MQLRSLYQYFILIIIIYCNSYVYGQSKSTVQLALMKYKGGGDWYANPTSLPNLAIFCNQNLSMNISTDIQEVEPSSAQIFNYPFIHITGHGNIIFSNQEAKNIRKYLMAGGFLHISDNYGLDPFIRREMKKVFPELDFVEIPFNHPIYHQKFQFPNGVPKIHEHDNKAPQGFALIWEGKVVCFYDYESDLGNGWEDISVHNDTQEKHLQALKMGANLVQFALIGE
jgi:hypothetical protein